MRLATIKIGLTSTSVLLSFVPGAQGRWLQPRRPNDGAHWPHQYSVYENAHSTFGGYTYAGFGPLPTVSSPSSLTGVAATSKNSGEDTSVLVPTSVGEFKFKFYLHELRTFISISESGFFPLFDCFEFTCPFHTNF